MLSKGIIDPRYMIRSSSVKSFDIPGNPVNVKIRLLQTSKARIKSLIYSEFVFYDKQNKTFKGKFIH